jgi:hypothetical protein
MPHVPQARRVLALCIALFAFKVGDPLANRNCLLELARLLTHWLGHDMGQLQIEHPAQQCANAQDFILGHAIHHMALQEEVHQDVVVEETRPAASLEELDSHAHLHTAVVVKTLAVYRIPQQHKVICCQWRLELVLHAFHHMQQDAVETECQTCCRFWTRCLRPKITMTHKKIAAAYHNMGFLGLLENRQRGQLNTCLFGKPWHAVALVFLGPVQQRPQLVNGQLKKRIGWDG